MNRFSSSAPITLLCLVVLLASTTSGLRSRQSAWPAFPVTIEEQADITRRSEPVRVSLPFAAGALRTETSVAITGVDGKPLPVQFEVLARWGDGSIRWLLARFLIDMRAGGALALTVVPTTGAIPAATGPDLARQTAGSLVVNTGVIRVEVGPAQGESFFAYDARGKALLARRPQLVVHSPTGGEHRALPPDAVQLEDNGPLHASIFVAGPMTSTDTRFDGIFRYETRLHLWRGLGEILAEHTVVAVGAAGDGVTIVDGIVLGTRAAHVLSEYVVAGQKETHAGNLSAGDRLRLKQTCAHWHETGRGSDSAAEPVKHVVLEMDFGYELGTDDGRELAAGEKSAGWLRTAGAGQSIGVAVRDFWEEGPRALRVTAAGALVVECYAHWKAGPGEPRPPRTRTPDFSVHPRLDHWFRAPGGDIEDIVKRFLADTGYPGPVRRGPMRFGQGRAKTTDVLYLFGTAERRQIEADRLASVRHALIPVVDPRYLASTEALPLIRLAASDSGLPVFEKGLLDQFENWKKHTTRYGFLHFGDDQCAFGYNRTVPSSTDDQEYDTTQCLTMQFARTGEREYLRRAEICARHFTDVDQVHPGGELHFHGYTSGADFHEEPVGVDMGGHPYIGGIVNHYMLTGDRRSLRAVHRLAAALADHGRNAREKVLTADGRSIARPGICLAAIYDLTRDPAHLEPARRMVTAINDLASDVTVELKGQAPFRMWWLDHSEMCYHVRELLVRYHAATGDPETLKTLRKALDLYLHDLWDSQHEAWRGWLGAPHDYNMPHEHPVARRGRSKSTTSGYAAAEKGMTFAYAANVTGDNTYLVPFLDYLDDLGSEYARHHGNRGFSRRQLWSLPFVSMLPARWRDERDTIVQREVFRARLRHDDGLTASTPGGDVTGRAHGETLWVDSPHGKVLRTHDRGFVTFPAPRDILELPGTVSLWVRRDDATWNRKPWPWYGALRGLLHIGSETRQTNALDVMMLKNNLWTRLYDHRGWETVAISSPSPAWERGAWHHVAVVWNRFDLTVFIDGKEVGHDDRLALPGGGQTEISLGWRPTNRYGQADYFDLRIFRAALPAWRIRKIMEER